MLYSRPTYFPPVALAYDLVVNIVQSPRCVHLFETPWTAAQQAFRSLTISQSLPKFMPIAQVMPSSHLILCHRLLLLPSIFPSIRVFSIELAFCIRLPKYWSFSFSITPPNEYSESSPATQFESINSSELCLLYGPALKTIHDYWKNHSLDYTDFCWQSDVFAF